MSYAERMAHTPIVVYMIITVAVVAVVAGLVLKLFSSFASAVNSVSSVGIDVSQARSTATLIVSALAVAAAIVIVGLAYSTIVGEEE